MQIIFRAITKNLLKLKKDFQFFGSLGLLLVCLDQLSKWLVEWFLITTNKSMLYILNPWLNFNLVTNTGAAFGLFTDLSLFLTLLSATVVVILPFYLKKELKNKIDTNSYFYGITFLWGGTAGNLIDRLSLGYVVDFIQIPYWPIFNLADSFIVFGVIFLIMNASKGENYE